MKKQFKIREEYSDFISYDLFEDDKRVGGGGLMSSEKRIKLLKKSLKKQGYTEYEKADHSI